MPNRHLQNLRRHLPLALSYMASGGSLVIASGSQLVTFAVLARSLGVDHFSVFVAITAFTAVAVQLCGLGAMDSLARRVSRNRADYPAMLGHNLILNSATGAVLMLIGLLTLPFLFPLADDPLTNFTACAMMLLANVPLLRFVMMSEQVFIAHSNFAAANRVVIVSSLMRAGAALTACLVFNTTDVAHWAVWHFAANGTSALLCVYWMRKLGKPVFTIDRSELPLGFYFSTQFIFRSLRQNADLMVLSMVSTAEVVSSYAVARRILDSSYISIDAMYRLAYPGSAQATAKGIHHGVHRVRQLLLVTIAISVPTVVGIYLLAPFLPLLFGTEYISLVFFVQALCWAGVILAVYAAALEMISAAGHQGARAAIANGANIFGAGLVMVAAFVAMVPGTIAATYFIEIATAIAAWVVLGQLVDKSRARGAAGAVTA